ncbi:MAG TPA: SMI1/KNR4 family protein [Thermoanaerobaculia bacterium]
MHRSRWEKLVERLRGAKYQFGLITAASPVHRIEFAPGLTDAEIDRVESCFGFRFPPDLREFLQTALPRGPQFPDWRSGDEATLRDWLDVPRQGILFDIEHIGFWLEEWGPCPVSLDDALKVASELIAAAPRLIPIFGHRMIPDEPHLPGNPVFSVHQTDIIYYGTDLENYLLSEFGLKVPGETPDTIRRIRFWDLDRFQEVRWSDGEAQR